MAKRRKKPKFLGSIQTGIKKLLFLVLFVLLAIFAVSYVRAYIDEHPQDFPWTTLSLNDPVGYFTGRKLAGLEGDFGLCQKLLDDASVSYTPLPPTGADQCLRDDNVSLLPGGTGRISYQPKMIIPSCPVVAAMKVWEDRVVQPAAQELLGQKVARIRHFGSYSCRKVSGSDRWSEHATANAIDVAAFVLEDGSTISLSGHWDAGDGQADFLRRVRDGSCDLFATVLSPDYNSAHADHFHLDQASRGATGYRMCR